MPTWDLVGKQAFVTGGARGIVHVGKADGTWSCYSLNDFRKHFVEKQ
jgi:hypothetical protein